MRARTGKIARLPAAVREELNVRLLEGQTARVICGWLNGLPETQRVIEEATSSQAYGGVDVGPIDDRNISDWRKGGYAEWLSRRERLEHTRELAQFAGRMARASGGSLSDGAAAILSGQILEVLESASNAETEDVAGAAESMAKLAKALVALRTGDHRREVVELKREKLGLDKEALGIERARFQRQSCELFLRWYEDQRAREAVSSGGDNAERIERLGQLMFGSEWAGASAPANAPGGAGGTNG